MNINFYEKKKKKLLLPYSDGNLIAANDKMFDSSQETNIIYKD